MHSRAPLCAVALFAVAAALAPKSAAAQDDLQKTLSTIEKALWEGWANKDGEPFRQHVVDNHLQIWGGGMTTGKASVIEGIEGSDCEVKSYSFANWAVHRVSDDTAILTYEAMQEGVCDGVQLPAKALAAAVYVRQNGKWLSASYQETPAGT